MRILHVVHEDPLSHKGGVQTYVRQIAEEQAAAGNEVTVFAMGRGEGVSTHWETVDGGVRYLLLDYNALGVSGKRFRFFESFRNDEVAALFRKLIGPGDVDVAHVHHLLLLSGELVHLMRTWPTALVATLHDYWYLCHRIKLLFPNQADCTGPEGGRKCRNCGDPSYSEYPGKLLMPAIYMSFVHRTNYLRGVLGAFDRILSPSLALRQLYIESGVPAHRVLHAPFGIRDVLYRYEYADRESRTFGYVGALIPAKGIEYLIRAFNELSHRPVRLRIHGAGAPDYEAHLRGLVQNSNVEFAGPFDNEDLPAALDGIDALVLPSIWKENSPVSVHEALAARVPVLASRIGGIPELVNDDVNGLLFEPRNAAAIRRAVERVLDNPRLLESFTLHSGMVKSFDDHVGELTEVYREVLRARDLCA